MRGPLGDEDAQRATLEAAPSRGARERDVADVRRIERAAEEDCSPLEHLLAQLDLVARADAGAT